MSEHLAANETVIRVTKKLFEIADREDWSHLNISERQRLYEKWTEDINIGGALRTVIDPNRVRVYIKDSIMGTYTHNRRPDLLGVLRSMSISYADITRQYVQPSAVLCDGRDLYTLAVAKAWKIAVVNCFERGTDIKHLRTNK